MKTKRLVNFLRCTQKKIKNKGVCKGTLDLNNDNILTCSTCGYQYKYLHGVPIIKSESETYEYADDWFEQMYANRSRSLEIKSNYLQNERKLLDRFVEEHHINGPCLEIGCGVGILADNVPNFIGLEYSLKSLLSEGFESFIRVCSDATIMPFNDAFAELIFSFNTLEHVPNVDLAFGEMDRVLKPGGFLILKPAWHCTRYNTELIPVLPYSQLNLRQKITKAFLLILRSKLYKLVTRIPYRLWRRITSRKNNSLNWERLIPYHGELWIADADATASIDSHEAILYYQSRGYKCLSHSGIFKQLLAGHDVVILRKP